MPKVPVSEAILGILADNVPHRASVLASKVRAVSGASVNLNTVTAVLSTLFKRGKVLRSSVAVEGGRSFYSYTLNPSPPTKSETRKRTSDRESRLSLPVSSAMDSLDKSIREYVRSTIGRNLEAQVLRALSLHYKFLSQKTLDQALELEKS